MELSPMRPLHRGAATAAALLLSAYPPNRLTAQRPLQATDYYKLVVVANPALSPDGRRVAFAVTTVVEDKDKRHSEDRKSTRLNSSHLGISYAVFCLKKKTPAGTVAVRS